MVIIQSKTKHKINKQSRHTKTKTRKQSTKKIRMKDGMIKGGAIPMSYNNSAPSPSYTQPSYPPPSYPQPSYPPPSNQPPSNQLPSYTPSLEQTMINNYNKAIEYLDARDITPYYKSPSLSLDQKKINEIIQSRTVFNRYKMLEKIVNEKKILEKLDKIKNHITENDEYHSNHINQLASTMYTLYKKPLISKNEANLIATYLYRNVMYPNRLQRRKPKTPSGYYRSPKNRN